MSAALEFNPKDPTTPFSLRFPLEFHPSCGKSQLKFVQVPTENNLMSANPVYQALQALNFVLLKLRKELTFESLFTKHNFILTR